MCGKNMAERVGFEPTAHCCVTGFQDRLLKPLGHLSKNLSESLIIITDGALVVNVYFASVLNFYFCVV